MAWNEREYQKLYRRFRRNFDQYLEKGFQDYQELTIEELQDQLAEAAEEDEMIGRPIRLRLGTLRKCIQDYRNSDDHNNPKEIYRWEDDRKR